MQTNFLAAINLIAEEKNLPRDIIIEPVQAALAAAYKKDYSSKDQEARAQLDEETGEVHIYESKVVVPDGEVENEFLQIGLTAAKKIDKKAVVRAANVDEGIEPYLVEMEAHPEDFGRVAAQT